jgi:peptidoglycan-N-acetylglucosamine deacetylase
VAIKPFVYVAAASVTVGVLIVAGSVLGRVANQGATPVAADAGTPTPPLTQLLPDTPMPLPAPAPSLGPSRTAMPVTEPSGTPTPTPTPSVTPTPTPTPSLQAMRAPGAKPAATGRSIQVAGIQPPRIAPGDGPFGAIVGTGGNTVALTFDDGPNPDWTPQVLDVLKQWNVKATFCLVGQNVEAYPELVQAIVADGNTLCDHTWDHNEQLGELSNDAIRGDMQRTLDAIEKASPGAKVSYFRAPGGNWTASVVEVARELGMTSLDWTVDPNDWTVPPVASIVNTITTQCVTGAIFLLHDGGGDRSHTVEAVREFLPVLVGSNTFIALPTGGA